MRNYRIILGFLLLILVNTSCTKYYYSFLQSDLPDTRKNELGDFVQENDSVCIIYSFHGEDLPVNITIVNKLDQPLYVDWNQSALIVDDVTEHFAGRPKGKNKADPTIHYSYLGESRRFTRDRYAGHAQKLYSEDGVSFIPPNARINHTPLVLTNFRFFKIPPELYNKTAFMTADEHERKVDVINFNENNSPVRFRSYMTLFTLDNQGGRYNTMSFDQSFYISTLIRGGKKAPENFRQYREQRGDFFFVRDERGKNAGLVTGLITAGVVGIAIEVAAGPYEY